ncbi:hypothetical protein [Streptomyces lydicus]|uniref:hypothetical protein n=1 Tax=Streptomyces lydicus TaxID=47763 RepID=UPI0036F11F10
MMRAPRDDQYAVRLALACFRFEAAQMEREATIRWVRERGGWSIAAIARRAGASPSAVRRLVDAGDVLSCDVVGALRARWGVDADPAASAAADHIVAYLLSDELLHLPSADSAAERCNVAARLVQRRDV